MGIIILVAALASNQLAAASNCTTTSTTPLEWPMFALGICATRHVAVEFEGNRKNLPN